MEFVKRGAFRRKKVEKFLKKGLHFGAACANILERLGRGYAPVAQLDRVTGYEPVGRGFESLPAYHKRNLFCLPRQERFFLAF